MSDHRFRYRGCDRIFHKCELADKRDSFLRAQGCWQQFPCPNDNDCKGERFCPPCLENVVLTSAELMCDY